MPNWCSNYIKISGHPQAVRNIVSHMTVPDDGIGRVDGVRHELNPMQVLPIPEDQSDNWYEWSIENWGTKWSMRVHTWTHLDGTGSGDLFIEGDTAWSPPLPLCEFIARYFKVQVLTSFYELGMGYCGAHIAYPDGRVMEQEDQVPSPSVEVDDNDYYDVLMDIVDNEIARHIEAVTEAVTHG